MNGNLTSDGSNTYTWNTRNQLVSISGAVAASFQYDAFGRRVSKTIGGTTQYLYDGANPVQEMAGTSVSANLLAAGVDEYFQRTDSAGARSFLTDALGSTLALADSSGTLQTSYTYEPFGNTTVSGAATTNSFAFTGREPDSTGLYFYRARYYSPALQRFIGEDPIGFLGGVNVYAYTGNGPSNWRDSFGTDKNGGCIQPSKFQRFGIGLQGALAGWIGSGIGVGLGVSAAYPMAGPVGVAFSASRQVVVTPNGEAAFVTTFTPLPVGVAAGAGGYGGFQFSISNAETPKDLEGNSVDVGFGGAVNGVVGPGGGGDFSFGKGTKGQFIGDLTVTVGVGAGEAGHGSVFAQTLVQPICP